MLRVSRVVIIVMMIFFITAKLLKNMLSATEECDFLDIFYSSISESEWNTLWVKLLMVSMGA